MVANAHANCVLNSHPPCLVQFVHSVESWYIDGLERNGNALCHSGAAPKPSGATTKFELGSSAMPSDGEIGANSA
jgi:hypothetical protein